MVKKASELNIGDVIRFEYGTYENWATCEVHSIQNSGVSVSVKGSHMGRTYDLEFSQKEEVQVLENGKTGV